MLIPLLLSTLYTTNLASSTINYFWHDFQLMSIKTLCNLTITLGRKFNIRSLQVTYNNESSLIYITHA